jgi:hypothetical protein
LAVRSDTQRNLDGIEPTVANDPIFGAYIKKTGEDYVMAAVPMLAMTEIICHRIRSLAAIGQFLER